MNTKSKYKIGDKVLVVAIDPSDLWEQATVGLVGTVEIAAYTNGYIQIRTDGNNMFEGKGIRITVEESRVVPVTDMSKAIYT